MLALIRNVGFKRNLCLHQNNEITRSIAVYNCLNTKSNEEDAKTIAQKILESNNIDKNSKDVDNAQDAKKIANEVIKEFPEVPTTCCMTGCANCVWLDYAEKLCDYYKDGGEKALKEIEEQIDDGNLKAFLMHEIRMRIKK